MGDARDNTLYQATAYNNNWLGVYVYRAENTLIDSGNFTRNGQGGYLDLADNTTMRNSYITDNTAGGMKFYSGSGSIYNNFFNNTQNIVIDASPTNTWNTTRVESTNIIGGPYLGGNFWATPEGNGASQTCSDNNAPYGICDAAYVIDSNNRDYLPLTPTVYGVISGCGILNQTGRTYKLAANITDSTTTPCLNITADNITLELDGNTIDGTKNPDKKAIHAEGITRLTVKNGTISEWGYGAYLKSANKTVFWKVTFLSNRRALDVVESYDGNITLNSFTNNNESSVSITGPSNKTNVSSNTVDNTIYGILVGPGTEFIVSGNTIRNATYGVYANKTQTATITGNGIIGCSEGIYAHESQSLTASLNQVNNSLSDGVKLEETNSSTLTQNTVYNASTAISMEDAYSNTLRGNDLDPHGSYGIYLDDSDDNTLDANNVSNDVNTYSIKVHASDYNVIYNALILGKGVEIDDSNGNTLINTTITSQLRDIRTMGNSHNTLLNTSVNRSRIEVVDAKSEVTLKWFVDVTVYNETFNAIADARVTCLNKTGAVVFLNEKTNEDGKITGKNVTEGVVTKVGLNYATPHSITASYTGYDDNTTSVFINSSRNVNIILKRTNQKPSVSRVDYTSAHSGKNSTTADPTRNDSSILFNATFTDDGGTHSLFICNTTDATTAGCTHRTWCSTGSQDTSSLIHCSYAISGLDAENNSWHAFVSDGEKISDPNNGTFQVNHPPAAGKPSIPAGTYYINSTITCASGTITDSDSGDSPQVEGYRWYRNDAQMPGQTSETLKCQDAGCSPNDAIKCDYNAVDAHGYSGTYSSKSDSITVQDRVNLTAHSIYVPFWCLRENTTIRGSFGCSSDLNANFTFNASLYARHNATYELVGVNQVTAKCNGSEYSTLFNYAFTELGEHNFTLILDGEGRITEVNEGDNQVNSTGTCGNCTQRDITASIYYPPAGRYCANQTLSIQTTVYSSINSSDNVSLSLYLNATEESRRLSTVVLSHIDAFGSKNSSTSWNPTQPGTYVIIAYANENRTLNESDYGNNMANRTLTVEYCPDLAVASSDVSFSPSVLVVNRSGTVTARVVNRGDTEARNVSVRFYANETQVGTAEITSIPLGGEKNASTSILLSKGGANVIRVTLDPANSILELNKSNNQAEKTTLVDTPPYVSSASITPATAYVNDTLACVNGSAYDAEGDAVVFRYRWFVNGSRITGQENANLSSGTFRKKDTVVCEITPYDGTANGSPVNSSGKTIGNTKPALTNVSVTPAAAYKNSTLECAYTAADLDNDTVSATYRWWVNATQTNETGGTLDGRRFNKKDRIMCEATPYDGTERGNPLNSSATEILNSAPTIGYPKLSLETAYKKTLITCFRGDTGDSDNDAVSVYYRWLANGATLAGEYGPTLNCTSTSDCKKNATLRCGTTPSDGDVNGTEKVSNATFVANTPPEVDDVFIPTPVYEGEAINCEYGTVRDDDADNVTLEYAWYRNGSLAGITSKTVNANETNAGEEWMCAITPNDGENTGASKVSNTLVIGSTNTPPTILNGTCDSGKGNPKNEGDNATFTVNWLDAEGDTIRLTVLNTPSITNNSITLCGDNYSNSKPKTCKYAIGETNTSTNNAYAFVCDAEACSSGYRIEYEVNHPPTPLTPPTINPTVVYTDTAVSCIESSFYDLDGDAKGEHTWKWFRDGLLVHQGRDLSPENFSKNHVLVCQQTPFDMHNLSGRALNSTPVTVRNSKPEIAYVGSQYAMENTPHHFDVNASDKDGDTLTFSDNSPLFVINPFSGEISFTPTGENIGVYTVNITASDGVEEDSETAYFIISEDTIPPTITDMKGTPTFALQDEAVEISANASDYSGINSVNTEITLPDASTRNLQLNPAGGGIYKNTFNETHLVGVYDIIVRANDSRGNTRTTGVEKFTIYAPEVKKQTTTVPATTTMAATSTSIMTTTLATTTTTLTTTTTTLATTTTSVVSTTIIETTTLPESTTLPPVETTTLEGATTTVEAVTTITQETTLLQKKRGTEADACANGVKDEGEEGVDCGGACKPCPTPQLKLNVESREFIQPGESFTLKARVEVYNADSTRLTFNLSSPPSFTVKPSEIMVIAPIKAGASKEVSWNVKVPEDSLDEENELALSLSDEKGAVTQVQTKIRVLRPVEVKIAENVKVEIPRVEVIQERMFNMMSSIFKASYGSMVFWLAMLLVLFGLAYVYYAVSRRR